MDNYNNYYIDNTQTAQATPYYTEPAQPPKKGMAITSMVIGILSMTLCCVGGSVLGLIGFILGIVALAKKKGGTGMSIAGIATSVIGMLIGVYALIYIFVFGLAFSVAASEEFSDDSYYDDYYDYDFDYDAEDGLEFDFDYNLDYHYDSSEPTTELYDTNFSGNSFKLEDDSVIYFEEDGSFYWYQSDDNHDNYYYSGTYSEYYGEDAVDYIIYGLSEYGVTEEELDAYFERNEDDDFYSVDNFCCLILHNDELIIDGENTLDTPHDTPYMGFYYDGIYDGANMNTGDYSYFEIIN